MTLNFFTGSANIIAAMEVLALFEPFLLTVLQPDVYKRKYPKVG